MSVKCKCDFCTGVKQWDGAWCSRCGEKVETPDPDGDMTCCDKCEQEMKAGGKWSIEHQFFKVIRKSNYDRDDWRGDQVFATSTSFSLDTAVAICNLMNGDKYRDNEDWFQVVQHDYVLPKPWEP